MNTNYPIPEIPTTEPFSLAEAQRGRELVTGEGRKARFIAHVPEAKEDSRVLAFVEGDKGATDYTENGRLTEYASGPCDLLLVAEPAAVVWCNLYEDGSAEWFETQDACTSPLLDKPIATVPALVKVADMKKQPRECRIKDAILGAFPMEDDAEVRIVSGASRLSPGEVCLTKEDVTMPDGSKVITLSLDRVEAIPVKESLLRRILRPVAGTDLRPLAQGGLP